VTCAQKLAKAPFLSLGGMALFCSGGGTPKGAHPEKMRRFCCEIGPQTFIRSEKSVFSVREEKGFL
jgi:hypothetical protein